MPINLKRRSWSIYKGGHQCFTIQTYFTFAYFFLKPMAMVQQKKIDFLLLKTSNHVKIHGVSKLGLFACGGIITKKPETLCKWFLLIKK